MEVISTFFTTYIVWSWLILGLLLILAELFLPGVFVIWLGSAAILNGITLYFIPDLSFSYQLLIYSLYSVICVIIGWYVYGQVLASSKKEYNNLNNRAESFIGKEYVLAEDVVAGRTKVKIGDSVWLASASDNLKAGDKVIVEKVESTLLYVTKK